MQILLPTRTPTAEGSFTNQWERMTYPVYVSHAFSLTASVLDSGPKNRVVIGQRQRFAWALPGLANIIYSSVSNLPSAETKEISQPLVAGLL